MSDTKSNSNSSGKTGKNLATDSRNELFKHLQFIWNGDQYQYLLDKVFREYVVSNTFCDKEPQERIDEVYFIYQMKDILDRIGKEVNCEN